MGSEPPIPLARKAIERHTQHIASMNKQLRENHMKLILSICTILMMLMSPVMAAGSALDGTWVGVTPRGSSIKVVVANGKATHYYFKGRSQGVIGGTVKGNSASFGMRSEKSAKVVLRKQKGDKLQFIYTDSTGPDALKVTLSLK